MEIVYVTSQQDERIFTFEVGAGRLRLIQNLEVPGGPAPLAVSPGKDRLFAGLRNRAGIAAFRIDAATGELEAAGSIWIDTDPCYLTVDHSGGFLLAAFFAGGGLAVYELAAGGGIGPRRQWMDTAKGAHGIWLSPDNRYAFAPHLSISAILQFRFDEKAGHLAANSPERIGQPAGAGSRHLCLHPAEPFAYLCTENAGTVVGFSVDPARGTLTELETVSTLPESYDGPNKCAQIHMTPDGRLLYVANRGHDSLACYRVDSKTGRLTPLGHTPTDHWSRVFAIAPDGAHAYIAGRDEGRVGVYSLDQGDGALTLDRYYPVGRRTLWIQALRLP